MRHSSAQTALTALLLGLLVVAAGSSQTFLPMIGTGVFFIALAVCAVVFTAASVFFLMAMVFEW